MKRMRKKKRAVLRSVPGARRRTARRLFKLVMVAGLAVTVLLMAGRSYLRGSWLTVTRIEVAGNRHWDAPRLLERAGVETGMRLHEIPFRAARRNLTRLPGVEAASVRYLPGGRVRVRVREAAVVAVYGAGGAWRGLTPDGRWMRLADAVSEDVPVLETGDDGLSPEKTGKLAAFLEAARAGHPDLFAGFAQIAVPSGRGTEEAMIYWRDGRLRFRMDYAGADGRPLELLRELLRTERDSWRAGATVDLRVEGYAYVR